MFRNFTFMISSLITLIILLACCNKKKSNPGAVDNWPTDSIRIVKQILDHVWEMEWSPDNHMWFTERSGRISKMNPQNGNIVFTTTINEVESNGEGEIGRASCRER